MVYVAGKYLDSYSNPTEDGTMENINKAIDIGMEMYEESEHKVVPMIPHLNYMIEKRLKQTSKEVRKNEYWYEYDNVGIPNCNALLRICIGGFSKGADAEWELAKVLGIPTFTLIQQVIDFERSIRQ